ncbi:MAG: hypothetical protein E7424_06550 [Ruminococcaceae bacterium]|nr:hypothetical protein [Oscillospiraceae bacterium]
MNASGPVCILGRKQLPKHKMEERIMKKRLLSMLLVLCMVCSLLPAIALTAGAAEGDLPTILSVEPSETNSIPARIDIFKASSSGGGWGGSSTSYDLYLPGNADPAKCFFSWADGLQATVDGKSYASGACPVPAVGQSKTYTFTKGASTATFTVKTWQGSATVPAIFIDIDESKGSISAMDNDPDHETSCTGMIFIDGEQFVLDKIKGRGNYTWSQSRDKKAYNLTLDKKVTILGIDSEKTKKWSILAEVADHSLLCNRTGLQMSHQLGIGNDTASADVWMNGEYQGCYTVTPKYDSFVTKDGYLIEDDNYKEDSVESGGDPQFSLDGLEGRGNDYNLISVKKMGDNLLMVDGAVDESPANMTAAANKIKEWLQDAWDAIRSTDGYNSKGKYYTEYIDIESFAKMYLMHEYVKSYDICAGSILFHRDGQTDADKLFAGPLWDLDNGMGSTQTNGNLGSVGDRRSGKGAFITEITEYKTSIYKTIGRHADFMEEVKRQYNNNREVFENAPAMLAEMRADIEASAMMNHNKVESVNYNNHNYGSDTVLERGTEYEQSMLRTGDNKTDWPNYVNNLAEYVKARSLWFTNTYEDDAYLDQGFRADFVPGTNASVTVFDTQQDAVDGVNGKIGAKYAFARDSVTGEIDDTGNGQVNFRVDVNAPYHVSKVTVEPVENFKNIKGPDDTGVENCYRVTKVTGPVTITIETSECEHEWGEDGKCIKCGLSAFRADFNCDEHCTVTVFPTQDLAAEGQENAQFAYARSKTGDIDISGEGQVNFIVNVDEGYKVSSIKPAPAGNYKNLKGPADTEVINGYRTTKVTGSFALNIKTKEIGQGMDDVDFTVKEDEAKYEVMGRDAYELVPGTGVKLTSTADAFEPLQGGGIPGGGGQTTESTPKDLIRVPVGDDWTATLKLDFNQNGVQWAMNEYFAFLAMAGEDYQNMAGIRGTNTVMQDFLRQNGTIATPTIQGGGGFPGGGQQTPQTGFTATGTYWLRLEKEDTTYTAYRSTDGEAFTELFKLENTGIDAEYIVIDAYKTSTWGMGGNNSYEYTLKELTFEDDGPGGPVLDRAALQKAIEDAEAVDKSRYTDETVAALEEALKAAKQANISIHSDQAAIDAAAEALEAAIEALVEKSEPVVDKTALNEAIQDAEEIDLDPYTAKSVGVLNSAVENAKAVQADDTANQASVNAAADAVRDAIANLDDREEYYNTCSKLNDAISSAEKYLAEDYTPESYAALQEALAAAKEAKQNAQQEFEGGTIRELGAAAKTLNDAIEALELVEGHVNKHDLIAVLTEAESAELGGFTDETTKAFLDAYNQAKALVKDPNATQADVDAAEKALKDAIAGFVRKPIFEDVQDPAKFYYAPVYWAYMHEPQITRGIDGTHFGPDKDCTRGQVVTFLWRAAGCPAPVVTTSSGFTDVKPGAFYELAVAWAVEKGITKGMTDTTFGPDATCTRGQIVTFLWRFKNEPAPKSTQTPFTDVNPNGYYMKAVAWAVENEVTKGLSDTAFGPDATCTRGQVVTFLYRATKD